MKHIVIILALALSTSGQLYSQVQQSKKTEKMEQVSKYTFALNENVNREKVTFKNRYGIMLTGDLYTPKNIGDKKLPALATTPMEFFNFPMVAKSCSQPSLCFHTLAFFAFTWTHKN